MTIYKATGHSIPGGMMQYFWPFLLYAIVAATPSNVPSGMCIGIPFQNPEPVAPILDALDTDCWLDWHFAGSGNGYVPMLFSRGASGAELQIMRRQPERLWLVLNEPDRPDQANMAPDEAVPIALEVNATGASWACCGTIAWDSSWLDGYLAAGGPLPDYWHIHIYGVQNSSDWQAQLDGFYDWMKRNGVERSVIVSETNAWGAPTGEQVELLRYVAQQVEDDDQLIAVFWFATSYRTISFAAVIDSHGKLTPVGQAFAARN